MILPVENLVWLFPLGAAAWEEKHFDSRLKGLTLGQIRNVFEFPDIFEVGREPAFQPVGRRKVA